MVNIPVPWMVYRQCHYPKTRGLSSWRRLQLAARSFAWTTTVTVRGWCWIARYPLGGGGLIGCNVPFGILAHLEFCLVGDCFYFFNQIANQYCFTLWENIWNFFQAFFSKWLVHQVVLINSIIFFRGFMALIYHLPTWCFINKNHLYHLRIYGFYRYFFIISWVIPIYPQCSKKNPTSWWFQDGMAMCFINLDVFLGSFCYGLYHPSFNHHFSPPFVFGRICLEHLFQTFFPTANYPSQWVKLFDFASM